MDAPTEAMPVALDTLLDAVTESPASYQRAAREIEAGAGEALEPVRVAVLSTFTATPIRPYLVVEGARRGMRLDVQFGPYDNIEQQILDPGSELYAFEPDVVVVAATLQDVSPELTFGFAGLPDDAVDAAVQAVVDRYEGILAALRERSRAPVIVFNLGFPRWLAAGLADPLLERSQAGVIQALNDRLAALCGRHADVTIHDQARLMVETGLGRWTDPKLWYLGRIPYGGEAQRRTGSALARQIRAVRTTPCKVLVLDLDNTLWGGVLGEEGLSGIAIGEDYPGNVFKEFQRVLRALRDRGVLLAIASKNNPEDVEEAFATHPDLVLRLEDFAATQVHWNDKATSIREIARELNLGTDAIAFFDDNPAERAWVRTQLPEVRVIDVPADPLGYVDALLGSEAFDHLTVSAEDRRRSAMYREEQERKKLASSAGSLDDFLRDLGIEIEVGAVDEATLPRVAQLVGKTNQFNLTTRRHTAADIRKAMEDGAIGLWLRASDRFGDHGLVGVAIAVEETGGAWRVDSFLLSCRVIGRRIEEAFLAELSRRVRGRGGTLLVGEFLATKKNRPAAGFYGACGFEPRADDPERYWTRAIAAAALPVPDMIRVVAR